MADYNTDIAIIGAGPVGLFAVFEAGMLKMRTTVIDTLDFIGGQCTALYPEKPIYDIPAHPAVTGQELIDQLKKQADPFKPDYLLGQQVTGFNKTNDGITLTTSTGNLVNCKAAIIAAGAGAFGPNKPPVANLEQFEEAGCVQYMVGNRQEFAGKNIVIAGGGDSAVDWANSLSELANKVYLVHRRPKFRAMPESVEKLHKLADSGKVELVIPYQLDSLQGDNGKLQNVIVKTLDGEQKTLPADVFLPFFGLSMELGPIAEWGLSLDKKHIAVEPSTMATNITGVYAVGDIATYQNKLKLILTGFSEVATACHQIYDIVYPDTPLHFEYSTTKSLP